MSDLIERAFAIVDPEQWSGRGGGTPAPPPWSPPALAEVRRRLREGLCPACGLRAPWRRRLLCNTCRHTLGYCPRCEAVAPLGEFWRPTESQRKRGKLTGDHKTCYPSRAKLSADERAEAWRPAISAVQERHRQRGEALRAAVVAAVEAAGGPAKVNVRPWWDAIGAPLGISGHTAEWHYRKATRGK
jgi:hypothetical protein